VSEDTSAKHGPDPVAARARLAILADGGMDGSNFGVSNERLVRVLDPSRAGELLKLIQESPLRNRRLAEFLPESLRGQLGGNGQSTGNGHASTVEECHSPSRMAPRLVTRRRAVGVAARTRPEQTRQERRTTVKEAFARLSKLSRADYDRIRIQEARELSIRIATLDKEVEALRPRIKDEAQGSDPVFYEPEPWAHPVDGAALLDEIVVTIRAYIVVMVEQVRTVALWIVAEHAFMAFRIFPRLFIKGPNSECGKSTLKEVVAALANRATLIDNLTAPFIFRIIEQSKPTLLIDEGDSFIRDDEERRGILNSGHHKNGCVGRIVGDDMKPKTFSTYCPTVIVAIGDLPVTIENRSLIIGMVRKLTHERVTRFTDGFAEKLKDGLACKVARFAADSFEKLAAADPVISEDLSNRKGDNWRPLFAVADLAGGAWPALARSIATGGGASPTEDETTSTMLLSDLRGMFAALEADGDLFGVAYDTIIPRPFGSVRPIEQKETDRARSEYIVLYLNSLTGRPWAAWNHGRG